MNNFRTTSLLLIFVFSIWKCSGNNEIDCGLEKCHLGYQFCETEKQICRQCSNFKAYCFQDAKHIANCSSYCKEQLPSEQTDCIRDLRIYVLTAVFVLVIPLCISLGVNYKMCRKYRRIKKKLQSVDDYSTQNLSESEERENMLLKYDAETQVVRLQESHNLPDSIPEISCHQFNQINPTNDRPECNEMAINSKILPLRVNESSTK